MFGKNKFICPHCYDEHSMDECDLKCSYHNYNMPNGTCKNEITKDNNGWIPKEVSKKCFKCNEAKLTLYCPVTKKEIPPTSSKTFPIALVGGRFSGKSNYVGVLPRTISKASSSLGITIMHSIAMYDKYKYEYEKPLKDGYAIRPNEWCDSEPLMFDLNFYQKQTLKKSVTLIMRDNLQGLDMESFNRHIYNSKGIVLFIDPLQLPYVRKQLEGKISLPPIDDHIGILNRIIDIIRSPHSTYHKKSTIDIPLAVVLTKTDILKDFGMLPINGFLCKDSESIRYGKLVSFDIEAVNCEVEMLLDLWGEDELLWRTKMFSKISFFGVSSLGGNPDDHGYIPGGSAKPLRVLDPFLWLLSQNKLLK